MNTKLAIGGIFLAVFFILFGVKGWVDATRPVKTYNHTLQCKGPNFSFEFSDINLLRGDGGNFVLEHEKGTLYVSLGNSVCAYANKE